MESGCSEWAADKQQHHPEMWLYRQTRGHCFLLWDGTDGCRVRGHHRPAQRAPATPVGKPKPPWGCKREFSGPMSKGISLSPERLGAGKSHNADNAENMGTTPADHIPVPAGLWGDVHPQSRGKATSWRAQLPAQMHSESSSTTQSAAFAGLVHPGVHCRRTTPALTLFVLIYLTSP